MAVGLSFIWTNLYVSSAIIQPAAADNPETVDRLHAAWQEATSRRSLSELIQRPNLDLYKAERNRQPLEDVIEDMKKDLRVELVAGSTEVRVSFSYPDRFKAQAVVDALTQKVNDQIFLTERTRWVVAPATLPETPIQHDRLAFLMSGLGIGLLAGVMASFLRWRTRWTMKVKGFGLAGLRIDAPHSRSEFTISFTYPDRFKAQAVLSALITKFTESEIVITEADLMAYHPPPKRPAVDDCIGKTADAYVDCITAYLGPIFPAAEALRRRKGAESIDVLDAASLPETPVAPDRRILAGAGLFVGLFLGVYALRKKPSPTLRHA